MELPLTITSRSSTRYQPFESIPRLVRVSRFSTNWISAGSSIGLMVSRSFAPLYHVGMDRQDESWFHSAYTTSLTTTSSTCAFSPFMCATQRSCARSLSGAGNLSNRVVIVRSSHAQAVFGTSGNSWIGVWKGRPPPRATALFRKTRANFKKCYNFLMKKGGFPLTGLL